MTINVVSIKSISFTGTTWINFVLSNHPDAVYLGPPDRSWKLEESLYPHTCLLHTSGTCSFWNKFNENRDSSQSFLQQFADATGHRTIIMANPTAAFMEAEVRRDDVSLKEIFVSRDGRGVIDSFLHHVPDSYDTVAEVAENWLRPACRSILAGIEASPTAMAVRYEDIASDPVGELEKIGSFIGLDYDSSALEFWQQEAHPSAGNSGTISTIAIVQGLTPSNHSKLDTYRARTEELLQNPAKVHIDESWRERFSVDDVRAYREIMGEEHRALGYDFADTDDTEISPQDPQTEVKEDTVSVEPQIAQTPPPETVMTAIRKDIAYSHEDFIALDPIEVGGLNPYGEGDANLAALWNLGPNYFRGYIRLKTDFTGGERVLDLLGGFGIWSIFLREVNDSVICLDRVDGCQTFFNNMTKFFSQDNMEFICDDVTYIEQFPDEHFDHIWMNSALQYVDRAYALSQAFRLLKPGGKLFVGNYNSTGLMIQHLMGGIKGNSINTGSSQWALNALAAGPECNGNPNYMDLESGSSVVREFGLEMLSVASQGYLDLRQPTGKIDLEPPVYYDHYPLTIEFVAQKPA